MPSVIFPKPQRYIRKVPLHWVLVVPFVLQTVGAVGLVGYFSYRSGQEAVADLANRLLVQVSKRVSDRLNIYLQTPRNIVANNQLAVKQGNLNIKDFEQLRYYLWQQMTSNSAFPSSIFWRSDGEVIGYRRIFSEEERYHASKLVGKNVSLDKKYLIKINKLQPNRRLFYQINDRGQPIKLVYSIVDVDFRQLPWYHQAKTSKTQIRSLIEVHQFIPILQIQAFAPIYDRAGKFQGVFNSNYFLPDISNFLRRQKFSPSGQVFIIERTGELVATSSLETLYTKEHQSKLKRLSALNSQNFLTKEIAQELINQFGSFNNIKQNTQIKLLINHQEHFVNVTPYKDNYGLNLLIIVVVPASDFMGSIYQNLWQTIGLCGLTFLGTTAFGIISAYYIAKPIQRLSRMSQELAAGNWQRVESDDSFITEVSVLMESFSHTAEQLKQSFAKITNALQESEARFTKVFHTSPDPISINQLGNGGKYLEVNDTFLQFSEYSREEVIGKTPEELNISADPYQNEIIWQQLQEKGKIEGFEFHYRTKSGRLGTSLLSIELVELDGQIRVLTIGKDISDRKQLEIALRASQDKLNDVLNSVSAAISSFRVYKNKIWEISYISLGCEYISGYTPAELQADQNLWVSRIIPEDWTAIESQIYTDIFAQQQGTYEYRLYHKNGSLRWISQTNTSRWDDNLKCWIVTTVSLDITKQQIAVQARKEAQEALRQNEERFRQLAAASPGVIYTVIEYPTGPVKYEYLSPAFAEIHEIPVAKALQDATITFQQIHPDDRLGYQQTVNESLATGKPFKHEWRIITPSGKIKWIQANSRSQKRQQGEIVWHGVVLDITEYKQAQEALRLSEERFQEIAHAVNQFFFVRSLLTGEYLYVSPAYEKIWHRSCESLYQDQNSWLDTIHPDDRDLVLASIKQQRKGETKREYRIVRPDGQIRWISAEITLIKDEAGNAVRVAGLAEDVTERKLTEEKLRQTEQWLNQFSYSSPSAIYTLVREPHGLFCFEYISSACETINGVTAEQAIKDAYSILGLIHPEDISGYNNAVFQSAEKLELFCYQWRIITPCGKLKWLQANSQPESRSNGAIAWHGVVIDITEQKQTEQALQQALQHIDTHFDECPLAIIEWDCNFRVLRWSKQAERIFGWAAEEVQSYSWQGLGVEKQGNSLTQNSGATQIPAFGKFVYDEDLDRVNAELAPLMKGLVTGQAVQNRNYTKDGRVIICQWYSSSVFDRKGNLVSVLSFAQDITDRKQAEWELKQQKELQETIFNESTDAIFLVNPKTRLIIDCNRRAVELFEVKSKAELIGIEGRTLQKYSFTDEELDEITQELRQKGFWTKELEYISRQGNYFWGNIAAKPVKIADQEITLVRVTDITQRQKIEAALLESEQTNRALIQSIPDLLIRMNRNGIYLDVRVNEGIKLFKPLAVRVGFSIFDILPQEIAQERFNLIQSTLATGKVQIQEYQLEIEGEIYYEEARIVPCGADEVLIIIRDVSERKSMEAALRESEERFRRAFDDAAIGMALVALDGRFLQVNLALCEITGYSEAELLGNFFQDITHPDELNADREFIRQILAGERRTYQVEKRYIHKSGHIVWGLLGVSVVKDRQGNPLYFITQIQDISERQKIDKIKDEFISIVSHELRTPLTAIRGSLGILETGVLDNRPEKAKYMLQVAVKNSDRLVRLVNDILDLERLESGKVELIMENCEVEDLMQQAVESVQAIANQANIKVELTPLVAEIIASPDAIIQALTNLLSNAIKFSPPHSIVSLSAEFQNSKLFTENNHTINQSSISSPTQILFQVKDRGRGIPADKLDTVFGRFQQIDISDARQKGGTGLGLAICKSIVQQHGGQIWVESTLGQGSVFYFTLPIVRKEV
ncbi:hypothetical protein NIES2119_15560 [[Phormidium ambiguum] IAM M-71]|uniref:histidine kinase n=1 Tax=[Phormidium ambiguum] IAM M-71 TaxID=454136 RepID=A0A1U7II42_9CYAN|nr:PAS domain S-box protein [Phormidium ambiguum]OKH36836.1 hypothetical protein NIES2119_15560 [Phormidium ambiguum IAM M-71]